jgi:DNA-binding PadR family transcriptional regulator
MILLALIGQKPAHGYDLHRGLSHLPGLSHLWNIKQGQLYAHLDKLERKGYLNFVVIPGETSPPRKEYHLSPMGQQEVAAWLRSPVLHARDMRQDFLARLYFARLSGRKTALYLVRLQSAVCQDWLKSLQHQAQNFLPQEDFEWYVFSFRIQQVQAMITWLAACEQVLAA